jgi:hypothetical protein
MSNPTSPETSTQPVIEETAELSGNMPLSRKLANLGRAALAVTCASLVLLHAETATASSNPIVEPGPPIPALSSSAHQIDTIATQPNSVLLSSAHQADAIVTPTLVPPQTDPTVYSGPVEGVATDGWYDDGLGYHTLFKDMAAAGLHEARLALLLNEHQRPSQEMRAEMASAHANDIAPVIGLPENMSPGEAAKIAVLLPGVSQFVYDNEPKRSIITPYEYVHKLAHMTAAIHAVRPDVQIRGFALASGDDPIGYLTESERIADRDFGGLENIMDGLDVHLYRSLTKDLEMIQMYIELYGGPIYVGEYGWIVGDPDHPGSVSLAEQAYNEVALRTALIAYPQVKSLDMYRFVSQSWDPFDTANISPSHVFRLAYFMLQTNLMSR